MIFKGKHINIKTILKIWNHGSWTLIIKCFIREKKTGIINVYVLYTIFSYQGFQKMQLFNINPFDSLWRNKLHILNICILISLCKWKEVDSQVICTYSVVRLWFHIPFVHEVSFPLWLFTIYLYNLNVII